MECMILCKKGKFNYNHNFKQSNQDYAYSPGYLVLKIKHTKSIKDSWLPALCLRETFCDESVDTLHLNVEANVLSVLHIMKKKLWQFYILNTNKLLNGVCRTLKVFSFIYFSLCIIIFSFNSFIFLVDFIVVTLVKYECKETPLPQHSNTPSLHGVIPFRSCIALKFQIANNIYVQSTITLLLIKYHYFCS